MHLWLDDTSIGFNGSTNKPAMTLEFMMKTLSEFARTSVRDTTILIWRGLRTFKMLLPDYSLVVGQSWISQDVSFK